MSAKREWELKIEEATEKLNLKWYKNDDQYSDGDIEEEIVKYIAQNDPEDYDKTICENFSWAVYYHLANVRKNLLNWYPFKNDASVLEIGAGCGAITGLLCDKCRKVTAVELSKRRATATRLRCREKDNLEVIVGNLNDIEFNEKFDYITLIGVLEYQGTYTDSDNPYRDFLVKIRSLLNDGGRLLIAIENKCGAKYWCGAVEDHTGVPFDGLNQYKLSGQKVRTFSREELTGLLEKSGYANSFYYYPVPDYKLPTVIYSEEYLPQNETIGWANPYYVPSDYTLLVDERGLYQDIIKNKVFSFFANSFLVECSAFANTEEAGNRVIFASLNSIRQKEYRVGTLIRNSGKVVKFAMEKGICVDSVFSQILDNTERIKCMGLKILPYRLNEKNELEMDFMELPIFEDLFRKAVSDKDIGAIWRLWDQLLNEIELSSEAVEPDKSMIYELGLDEYGEEKNYGTVLRDGYVDMIPKNCFVKGNTLLWFDQEWVLDNIPSKFILYRGMVVTYKAIPEYEDLIPRQEFVAHYELEECLDAFMALEELFLQMIIDPYYAGGRLEYTDPYIYRKNVLKLL